jgi:hypothetical protein
MWRTFEVDAMQSYMVAAETIRLNCFIIRQSTLQGVFSILCCIVCITSHCMLNCCTEFVRFFSLSNDQFAVSLEIKLSVSLNVDVNQRMTKVIFLYFSHSTLLHDRRFICLLI